jgi:hypothetical protein
VTIFHLSPVRSNRRIQGNRALELKYAKGRNFDTLEPEQVENLGLGFNQ